MNSRQVYLFAFVLQVVSLAESFPEEWIAFKKAYNKSYEDPAEDLFRMNIFYENKNRIEQHNEKFKNGIISFEMETNRFADMRPSEIIRLQNKYEVPAIHKRSLSRGLDTNDTDLPSLVDWREKGAVTEVKTQGACGACWAFAATGALEGHTFLKTGQLVSLSEQNLIDCSREYGNKGCDGGLLDHAFQYVTDNGGIAIEDSYPYEIKDGSCRFNRSTVGARASGYVALPRGDEGALKAAVARVGPVSAAIDTDPMSLYLYSSGVYHETKCSSTKVDHGVLVVGYGTTESGEDYWLVKNSWGPDWGEQGFFRIARNSDNHCGIASKSVYPIVN